MMPKQHICQAHKDAHSPSMQECCQDIQAYKEGHRGTWCLASAQGIAYAGFLCNVAAMAYSLALSLGWRAMGVLGAVWDARPLHCMDASGCKLLVVRGWCAVQFHLQKEAQEFPVPQICKVFTFS